MTPERIREILAGGETLDVELKSERKSPLGSRALVEAVVCLANRPGNRVGYLLLGVEDDGRVTGARSPDGGPIRREEVEALIANKTRPPLHCRAEVVEIDDAEVLVIEVAPSPTPVCTSHGVYLRRTLGGKGEPQCVPYPFHEMQARQADRGLLDYSALPLPEACWEDLEPLEFDRFRRNISESMGLGDRALLELSNLDLAKALGAVEANHEVRSVHVAGLLLFGKEEAIKRLLPTHEVAFQVLAGLNVEVNDFFRWPLLRVMEEILTRFRARYREEEILVGFQRIGVPDYSERAFREAVANALIHRDYTCLGAVHVQWWSDRIQVSSPGGFPEGVRLDNLLSTGPRPRNPCLADAFKRAGIVERTARGIDTIFSEQIRAGRPAPSYAKSTPETVVVELPGGDADLAFVRRVVERGKQGEALTLETLQIMWDVWRAKAPTGELVLNGEDGLILVSVGSPLNRAAVDASRPSLGLERAAVLVEFEFSDFVGPDEANWEEVVKRIRNQVRGCVEDPRYSRLHLFYHGPIVIAPLLGALGASSGKPLVVYYYGQGGHYRRVYTLDRRLLKGK